MKREARKTRRVANKVNLVLPKIEPLTENQAIMLESKKHVVAHGAAGTGKTFLATVSALEDIMVKDKYSSLTYLRSAVPTRQLGFLPGDDKEKVEVYEQPYRDICYELYGRSDAYDQMKHKGIIRFMSTSFIRGSTLNDTVIIVDECQNMTLHELDSIITRAGDNCRIFFCGDQLQNGDLGKEVSGLAEFAKILRRMNEFDFIEFTVEDVVRSGLVKSYLEAKYSM